MKCKKNKNLSLTLLHNQVRVVSKKTKSGILKKSESIVHICIFQPMIGNF